MRLKIHPLIKSPPKLSPPGPREHGNGNGSPPETSEPPVTKPDDTFSPPKTPANLPPYFDQTQINNYNALSNLEQKNLYIALQETIKNIPKQKKYFELSPREKEIDDDWLKKKRDLSNEPINAKKEQLGEQYAIQAADNSLSEEDWQYITGQTYFWTDIISVRPPNIYQSFVKNISVKKFAIAVNSIFNQKLMSSDPNIKNYIINLVKQLNDTVPNYFEKLKACAIAAVADTSIADAIHEASIRPSSLTKEQKAELKSLFNNIKKVKDYYQPPVIVYKPPKPRPQVVSQATNVPIVSIDKDLELADPALQNSYQNMISSNVMPNVGTTPQEIEICKKLIRILLQDNINDPNKLKNIFQHLVRQYNITNNFLSFVLDITKKPDLKKFISFLPDENLENYIKVEASLIQQSLSLRKLQAKRLRIVYRNMSDDQLRKCLQIDKFWTLLFDLPKAAAKGFTPHHFAILANYILSDPTSKKNQNLAQGMAKEIISKLDVDKSSPDEVYNILLSMAPIAQFSPPMEDIIAIKLFPLGIKLPGKDLSPIKNAMKK
jgi:hypothetical protein